MKILNSVNQWITDEGDIYIIHDSLTDMLPSIGNIMSAPHSWWKELSSTDRQTTNLIFNNISEIHRRLT